MPRKKTQEPREWLEENGIYPYGPFKQNAPEGVLAAACFARNLIRFMNGSAKDSDRFDFGQKESQLSLSRKAGVSQGVISRILAGRSFPDVSTIANLELRAASRLWCGPQEREDFYRGDILFFTYEDEIFSKRKRRLASDTSD